MPLDAAAVFSPLDRITDADGEPVAGGTIEFYEAGTSTPKTVYADRNLSVSLGTSVSTDAGGYPVTGGGARTLIYVGTSDYKVVVKDASGAVLVTHDNVPGAPDIPDTTTSALPTSPVVSRTSTYTIVVGDRGKVINCSATSFALTLPSASVAGDNWRVCIRHVGAAGQVYTVRTTASQTITFGGQAKTAFALTGYGESVWISCDGSGYHVDAHASPLMKDGLPFVSITDRLSSPPVSPTGGARYIINGTPTGVWSTLGFVEKQIAESDGNGSWFAYTPGDGWLAYVADEDLLTQYRSSSAAWVDLTNVTAPTTSALKVAVFADEKATNTSGGTPVDDAWTTHALNTTRVNNISGCSLASNQITLPTGKYKIDAQVSAYAMTEGQIRLYSITNSTVKGTSAQVYTANYTSGTGPASILSGAPIVMTCYVEVTAASEVFELQYYTTVGGVSSGLGRVRNVGAEPEVYAVVSILDLTSIQGPRGEQGPEWRSLIVTDTPNNVDPTSGYFADYEGLAAVELVLSQAEVQAFDELGGWRSAFSIEHQDSDDTNYSTGPYQTISDGLRAGAYGKQSGGVYQPQYKDLVGLSAAAIGRIEWTSRGVSGITTEAIQYGSGIASNEFAVLNPSAASNQSVSMAAVQAIVSGKKAAADASHFVRAVLATNVGKLATAAFEAVSAGTDGDNGQFAYLLKGDLTTVSTAAIYMPASASGDVGTRIVYDTNDYTEFIRASNIYTWFIGGGGKLALAVDALYPLDSNLKLGVGGAGFNGVYVGSGTGLYVGGTKVVGNQGAAVADASGGATIDTEARTAINTLLARLRAHGLIAT